MTLRPMDAANTMSILYFDPPDEDPWPLSDEETSPKPTYKPFVGFGFHSDAGSRTSKGVVKEEGNGNADFQSSCVVRLAMLILLRSDEPDKHHLLSCHWCHLTSTIMRPKPIAREDHQIMLQRYTT